VPKETTLRSSSAQRVELGTWAQSKLHLHRVRALVCNKPLLQLKKIGQAATRVWKYWRAHEPGL
jgi:hypothetical protein